MEKTLTTVEQTEAYGAWLAGLLRRGDVVLLDGPLGAGKTALARAMLRSLTGDPTLEVPSPTYTLVQSYETPLGVVQHFDLWRLAGPDAMLELGWDEAELTLVEWPDRLGPLRPADALELHLDYKGEGRIVRLTGWEGRF